MNPRLKRAPYRRIATVQGVWGYVKVTLECGHARWVVMGGLIPVDFPCLACLAAAQEEN